MIASGDLLLVDHIIVHISHTVVTSQENVAIHPRRYHTLYTATLFRLEIWLESVVGQRCLRALVESTRSTHGKRSPSGSFLRVLLEIRVLHYISSTNTYLFRPMINFQVSPIDYLQTAVRI
ncbi:uncharacterized protein LOC116849917 [Odontomachus brunneus]|uniref:uncharacterized protein LOC116849917 n=1 Tax=Odontomachus brunneus TaxID=486640 RepID=UPI0013F18A8E|nr:uncharacterized protein LOC116849917 [Odontomachus brunneus]